MLRALFGSEMPFGQVLVHVLISILCVFLSLTIHEMCHGIAARLMGDKTAERMGRISLNPLHHIDPFGALCLLFFGFGWAKPVPINPWNFKNRKLGMALSALGGPVSNFILAFIAQIGVVAIGSMTFAKAGISFKFAEVCYLVCYYMVFFNLGLGIFNLIPIPPLDGSKVLNAILPERIYFRIMEYERYGFIVLIILINMPFFNGILNVCESGILNLYNSIIGLFL